MRHVAAAAALVLALVLPTAAFAAPGDYRLVQGRITVWPPEPFAYGVAAVQTDSAPQPSFVEFTPATALPPGLQAGDLVAVVGREGVTPDRVMAVTVERRGPSSGTPGWQTVSGGVESVSGSTAVMRLADGRRIAIDLSDMTADFIRVHRGQELTVTGLVMSPTLIRVRGMATSTGNDAPAASPRTAPPRR